MPSFTHVSKINAILRSLGLILTTQSPGLKTFPSKFKPNYRRDWARFLRINKFDEPLPDIHLVLILAFIEQHGKKVLSKGFDYQAANSTLTQNKLQEYSQFLFEKIRKTRILEFFDLKNHKVNQPEVNKINSIFTVKISGFLVFGIKPRQDVDQSLSRLHGSLYNHFPIALNTPSRYTTRQIISKAGSSIWSTLHKSGFMELRITRSKTNDIIFNYTINSQVYLYMVSSKNKQAKTEWNTACKQYLNKL